MTAPKTLYDKIWDAHVADQDPDGTCRLYIDRHLVHEGRALGLVLQVTVSCFE